MSSSIQHFLLVFDHAYDELLDMISFGTNVEMAAARYAELEESYQGHNAIDIVLVGSESVETVKVTHRTYFEGFKNASLDEGTLETLLASVS